MCAHIWVLMHACMYACKGIYIYSEHAHSINFHWMYEQGKRILNCFESFSNFWVSAKEQRVAEQFVSGKPERQCYANFVFSNIGVISETGQQLALYKRNAGLFYHDLLSMISHLDSQAGQRLTKCCSRSTRLPKTIALRGSFESVKSIVRSPLSKFRPTIFNILYFNGFC